MLLRFCSIWCCVGFAASGRESGWCWHLRDFILSGLALLSTQSAPVFSNFSYGGAYIDQVSQACLSGFVQEVAAQQTCFREHRKPQERMRSAARTWMPRRLSDAARCGAARLSLPTAAAVAVTEQHGACTLGFMRRNASQSMLQHLLAL